MSNPDKMTKEVHLKLVEAWWDGRLEYNFQSGWGAAINEPTPASPKSLYRIRPEPKLRPWKPEEVPYLCVVRLTDTEQRMEELFSIILGASTDGVQVVSRPATGQPFIEMVSFQELLTIAEHSTDGGKTWLPCGKESQ